MTVMTMRYVGSKASVETIVPLVAATWLRRLHPSKPPAWNRNRVARYAEDMTKGRWTLSGDPIVFDEDGRLINGECRLRAVVRAGMPTQFVILRMKPELGF